MEGRGWRGGVGGEGLEGRGWRGGMVEGRAGRGWGWSGGGWDLRYSAVRAGSVRSIRSFSISDTDGSVGDTQRYAIKVLLKRP